MLEWKSKYTDPEAQKAIRQEAAYLFALLALAPTLLFVVWRGYPGGWLGIPDTAYPTFVRYASAWLAGMLGGTLFDVKWLYHSIAKRIWHMDRRLWRLFTPHISGGLSFAVTALFSSGIIRLVDGTAVQSGSVIVGLGFLVGYFSDTAIAKLSEVAETLFGARQLKPPDPPKSSSSSNKP